MANCAVIIIIIIALLNIGASYGQANERQAAGLPPLPTVKPTPTTAPKPLIKIPPLPRLFTSSTSSCANHSNSIAGSNSTTAPKPTSSRTISPTSSSTVQPLSLSSSTSSPSQFTASPSPTTSLNPTNFTTSPATSSPATTNRTSSPSTPSSTTSPRSSSSPPSNSSRPTNSPPSNSSRPTSSPSSNSSRPTSSPPSSSPSNSSRPSSSPSNSSRPSSSPSNSSRPSSPPSNSSRPSSSPSNSSRPSSSPSNSSRPSSRPSTSSPKPVSSTTAPHSSSPIKPVSIPILSPPQNSTCAQSCSQSNAHLHTITVNGTMIAHNPAKCPCLNMELETAMVDAISGPGATGRPDPGAPDLQMDHLAITDNINQLQNVSNPFVDDETATFYTITFNLTSERTRLFSPIVCASHSEPGALYSLGALSSPGFEIMMEYAVPNYAVKELNDLAVRHQVGQISLSGGYMVLSPDIIAINMTASRRFPLISCATMLYPSPDFFTGFNDLDMFSPSGGQCYESIVLNLPGLDAGTDGGQTFNTTNVPIYPTPIAPIAPTMTGIGSVEIRQQ